MIGGGITGAGVALDAASRGYSVALLERDDYAVGTSSRSSKMVHGGLRYLQNFDLGLVREALLERQLMVQLAPHLVYPTPFLVPTFGEERRDRKLGIGLNMYDVMATTRVGRSRREMRSSKEEDEDFYWSPDRHRTIDRDEVLELVPALAPRDPNDAYLFYDCQTDDVRLVLTVLGEAERFGAVMLNGAEVTEVLDDGRPRRRRRLRRGRVRRARSRSSADNVVNATGVWADRIRPEEMRRGGGRAADRAQPRHPRAARPRRPADRARPPASSRPARGGRSSPCPGTGAPWSAPPTTTTRATSTTRSPAEDDVDYLLDAVNDFFGTELGAADLAGAYAGVRPLISTGDPKKSVDISRKAELYETSSGMLTITGGKLTTWRRMAKQTVDRLVEREGREAPCHTAEIPLGMEARPEDLEAPDGRGGGGARASSPSATGTRRATCSTLAARATRSWRRRSSPAAPTCSPRSSIAARLEQARTRRRRAAAPHPARAARGAAAARRRVGARRSPRRSAAELGWSRRRVKRGGRGLGRGGARPRASIRPAGVS